MVHKIVEAMYSDCLQLPDHVEEILMLRIV